ncbi:hypothetical protein NM688_g808 [Phlebia brevispora]|uniref:Uncharacterized protein n=1 Tax=Phlebia brevispora TaxID=194682 RepID=A0ACC1TCY9_9APHY|nr:hypothetical protein NM688_g808 [Phlebia brevispora]
MSSVLWPENVRSSGFIYGWSSPLICVAGVLDFPSRAEADLALHSAIALDRLSRIKDFCGSNPTIIGHCTLSDEGDAKSQPHLKFYGLQNTPFSIVTYRPPNLGKLEIHTLDSNVSAVAHGRSTGVSLSDTRIAAHLAHDFTRPSFARRNFLDSCMNYGQLFQQYIMKTSPKALLPLRGGAKQVGSAFARLRVKDQILPLTCDIYPVFKYPYDTIMESSALCRQLCLRSSQLLALPGGVPVQAYDDGLVSVKATADYVAFYNTVWLILNDVIIGWAIGSFIRDNASPMASLLDGWLRKLLVDDLRWTLLWLNNWPAGLKLNTELSQFLCHTLLLLITAWNGCLGYCGITMTIAAVSDLLALVIVHAHGCYFVLCVLYRNQLSVIGSLWNLFRGKRYNVLRRRIDSWHYDVDQLLFGTILFTLMAFLLPTTVTYYTLFALLRLFVTLVYALSDILLVLVNEFPLFALLLRVKDPFRMPGGVVYVLSEGPQQHRLKAETASIGSIFAHYGAFWSAFSTHYRPAELAKRFVTSKRFTHLTFHDFVSH